MRKISLAFVALIVTFVVMGCSGGTVTEAGALDKAAEIEQQTKAAGGEEQKK